MSTFIFLFLFYLLLMSLLLYSMVFLFGFSVFSFCNFCMIYNGGVRCIPGVYSPVQSPTTTMTPTTAPVLRPSTDPHISCLLHIHTPLFSSALFTWPSLLGYSPADCHLLLLYRPTVVNPRRDGLGSSLSPCASPHCLRLFSPESRVLSCR